MRLPFVIIDLPFGLVLDTVLVPFIATGVVETPRAYDLHPEDVPWTETREMKRDAQPQGGGYSPPATRSSKPTP